MHRKITTFNLHISPMNHFIDKGENLKTKHLQLYACHVGPSWCPLLHPSRFGLAIPYNFFQLFTTLFKSNSIYIIVKYK